jgi:hypothetical protein
MTDVSRGSASNGSRGSSTYDDESSSYHESYRIEDSDSDEDDKNEKIVKSTLHNDELDEVINFKYDLYLFSFYNS